MTGWGINSSTVDEMITEGSLRAVGGYAACAKERFPVVFVLVEAKPVEISDPAVVGDSFSILHLSDH